MLDVDPAVDGDFEDVLADGCLNLDLALSRVDDQRGGIFEDETYGYDRWSGHVVAGFGVHG